MLPPTLLQQLLPNFFVSSRPETLDSTDNMTGVTKLRNDGYLYFHNSLLNYTLKHYSTLSTAFLERILLQVHALSPLTKLASCLQLDNPRYNAEQNSCDRLTILIGVLFCHFGTDVVDSFLHPLFTKHFFNERRPQQSTQAKNVLLFKNLVLSRGGSFEEGYQHLQTTLNQPVSRWECSIKYQLSRNTPFVIHRRNGQSKKQARLRALHDIHNYYTRNYASLVSHCSSSSSTSLYFSPSPHPHGQQLGNQISEHAVEILSIPTDQLYQYDDPDSQQSPSTVLSVKRSLENITEDSSQMEFNSDDDNNETNLLTYALLYDFSNLSFNDSPQPSPTNLDSPGSIFTLKQPPTLNESAFTSPTSMPSPSSITTSSIATEPMNEEWLDQPMTKENGNKKQRTYHLESVDSQQQQQQDVHMDQQPPSLILSNPLPQQQKQMVTVATLTPQLPQPPQPSYEELSATATRMMSLLAEKLRQRLTGLAEQLAQSPCNTKGHLINLAAKLDNGYYTSELKHVQPERTKLNSEMPYFSATVRFGMAGMELVLTRCNSKKTDAEVKAAFAIFELLVNNSSNQINSCTPPSPSPSLK
ncbi:unnamed protein product [Absidia cylindrospora]